MALPNSDGRAIALESTVSVYILWLKELAYKLSILLIIVITVSRLQQFPEVEGPIVPSVFKSRSRAQAGNFKPIFLISIIGKILEEMIANRQDYQISKPEKGIYCVKTSLLCRYGKFCLICLHETLDNCISISKSNVLCCHIL